MPDIDYDALDRAVEDEVADYVAAHPVEPRMPKAKKKKQAKKPKPAPKSKRQPKTETLMMPSDYAGRIHRGRGSS